MKYIRFSYLPYTIVLALVIVMPCVTLQAKANDRLTPILA